MAVTTNKVVLPQGIVTATAVCTAAKTTYADATNAVRLVASGSNINGALVKELWAMARASVGATQLQLYRSSDVGVTLRLVDSALLPAYTMSATTAVTKGEFSNIDSDNPMRLAPLEELWVGIGVSLASGIVFNAEIEVF